MPLRHHSFGVLGALGTIPLRLASRRVAEGGGRLYRGTRRRSTHIVVGRSLLMRYAEEEVERRVAKARESGLPILSENAFLRLLEGEAAPSGELGRRSLLEQSQIDAKALDHLSLFDAFEHHTEPYSFRDLILARKYAGLLATDASWSEIARSVHRIGPVASLTALTLHPTGHGRIIARDAHSFTELDGQRLLPLDDAAEEEDYFGLAEQAEEAGLLAEAATLYRQCLASAPGDATAAFNLGNCERALGDPVAAALAYTTAIKRDPEFVEAWFNLGHLHGEMGRTGAARTHLLRAVELDGDYADAIYNLGVLEYDAGSFPAALSWWRRYLELDATSEWAKRARAGIAIIEHEQRGAAG
ncbi:MAG TPA: tetratricopeptide repeat protein [Devosiaceae bacterium]|jgi:tetratricopeptide (TPR) repeat protein|nr:tetratricopeptide repeat protein [Devosiaceae bacterium]